MMRDTQCPRVLRDASVISGRSADVRQTGSTETNQAGASHSDGSRNALRAFSLLEMIAVLAVIAALVAAVVPRWIKRIDLAVRKAEANNLLTISNALSSQVLRGVPLFDSTTWSQAVADWSMLPVSQVAANRRRYSRVYFVEENAYPPPGYSQAAQVTLGLANRPQNLRAMVVSILHGDALDASNCPNPTGGALSASQFNELWSLADGARPTANEWANWKGVGDDFLVQRVNYAPLFHHLVLLNRETNAQPAFTINNAGREWIPRGTPDNAGWDAYYLRGTVVGLWDPVGNPMTRYVLQQDISFVWEARKWRAELLGAPDSDSLGDDFSQKAREFLDAARYGGAFKGANQQGVVAAMYNFMFAYVFWANECPLFTTHGDTGVSHENVAEYRILDWIGANNGRLDEFSRYLVR